MTDILNLLIIGTDKATLESVRHYLNESQIQHRITYFENTSEMQVFDPSDLEVEAVLLCSKRTDDKTIEEIRKINQILPRSTVILLTAKTQLKLVIGAFRAGLFDFLSLPLDKNEMRTVFYRLKLHGIIKNEHLSPERALLQYFSRPENFSSVEDVTHSLMRYLETFLIFEKEMKFYITPQVLDSLSRKTRMNIRSIEKIRHFIDDNTGLIFGLKIRKDKFHFLLKRGIDQVSYIVARNISNYDYKDVLNNFVANVLRTSLIILDENNQKDQMKLLSQLDDVTGLYNQRKLLEDLNFFVSKYPMDHEVFSLLFIDIDHFKNVNDQYGHVIGSKLLTDLAGILRKQLRGSDLVYRYGGDEFIVLLPNTDLEHAKKIAVRMSWAIKNSEFELESLLKFKLTLSVGIASFPDDAKDARAIIDFADQMMYLSKKSGRGKVFHLNEIIHQA